MIFLVSGEFEFNPKYDDLVWSGMCYLKEIGKDYSIGGFDMSIVSKNGKYGLIYTEHWNVTDEDFHAPVYSEIGALECVYDAIYSLDSENSGRFVVFQGGKCGLVQAVCTGLNQFLECKEIFPCVYDRIELIGKDFCRLVILQSGRKMFYYNIDTGQRSIFYDRIWVEKSFVFAAVGRKTVVIDGFTDKTILESNMFFDYLGVDKNRFVFLERSKNLEFKRSGKVFADGRFCFYNREKETVRKTKIYKNATVILDKPAIIEEVFDSLERRNNAKRVRCSSFPKQK